MSAFWAVDKTFTDPPSYETTAESDETLSFDTTALLIGGGAPSAPEAILFRVVDGGADAPVALADSPQVASGNTITQRLRGLAAGTTYRYRLTFLTSGNRRAMTTILVCRE